MWVINLYGIHGIEMWSYDGVNPPALASAFLNGSAGSLQTYNGRNGYYGEYNSKLYFGANNGLYGFELFSLDGVNEPSINSNQNSTLDFQPIHFVPFGNRLYFSANGGTNGQELWVLYE